MNIFKIKDNDSSPFKKKKNWQDKTKGVYSPTS